MEARRQLRRIILVFAVPFEVLDAVRSGQKREVETVMAALAPSTAFI